MNTRDVERLIQNTGWKYKVVSGGNELLLETCPYCHAKDHFYINRETGRFNCKKVQCSAKGGLYQLQLLARQVVPVEPVAPLLNQQPYDPSLNLKVEAYHQALWQHPQALEYLIEKRKLSRKAIMHFKLGVVKEYNKEWITLPHIHKNKVLTIKYRRLDQKQYRHLRGTTTDLYHQDASTDTNEVIVAEGEFDAIALWSNGYRNVVAIPGAGQWKPEWMDYFSDFTKIYLCFDQDDAGKLGAKELAKKFGYERCFAVQLPLGIKDVNDFFVHSSKGKSKFSRLLEAARVVDVPYVIKAGDSIRDIILKKRVIGDISTITTPWESLNDIIGGIVPESLVLLTSHPGVGKSLEKGTPILMYDGSVRKVETIKEGEQVMGPDSKPRIVSSTHSDIDQMYKIIPIKGKPFVCNGNHILSLTSGHYTWKNKKINISVDNYLNKSIWFKSKAKLWKTGVEFKSQQMLFDPYLIGIHLGDGATKASRITLGKGKKEIISYINKWCKKHSYYFNKIRNRDQYTIAKYKRGGDQRNRVNPFVKYIKAELFKNNQRTVPKEYLINDRKIRLQVLAGLLDTDGYLYNNCYEIITKYLQLANDIEFLAGSLGFCVTRRTKIGTIKKIGFSGKYERIIISGNTNEIPCKVKHKQATPRKQIKNHLLTGFTIEKLSRGRYYGFTLDGDGLFLLGDFTVTHNSTLALQWMYHLSREGRSTGYVCIEMSSEEMTKRLLNVHTRQPTQTAEERMSAMKEFESYPLYWIDLAKHAGVHFDVLAETLRDAVPRYDLQVVVVDHFHFMARSIKYITQETGKLAQQFKLLARELGIPIICIAHVTKYAGVPRRLIGTDLRDTGLLYGDSDYIFILHRKPLVDPGGNWDGEWEDKAELSVFKSRHSNTGVVRNLHFYGEIGLIS